MSSRAVYTLIENGKTKHYDAYYGANAFSPILRLTQAREIQEENKESIGKIFDSLTHDGEYHNPPKDNVDTYFKPLVGDPTSYRKGCCVEMFITLDLDKKSYILDFNENYHYYETMGKYELPLELVTQKFKEVMAHGEKHELHTFGELLNIFNKVMGLSKEFERSRGDFRFKETLNSPESEQMRHYYNAKWKEEMEETNDVEGRD